MQGVKIAVNFVGAWLDIALITVTGYVDTTTCQEVAKVLQDLVRQKKMQIIADLGGITYISSAGWGVFVGEIKNIREKGGDLKVVQMNPEVYEVFEMLEFNRIICSYDTLEEAINEFDIVRGIDITQARQGVKSSAAGRVYTSGNRAAAGRKRVATGSISDKISLREYPLNEKVKMIAIENPFWGIRRICRQLNTDKFGNIRLGWMQAYMILRKLNLESKEKRYRFHRSR